MKRAVRVPQREHGVACLVARLANFSAGEPRVRPADVVHDAGMDQRVVERRVETGSIGLVPAVDLNTAEALLPCDRCGITRFLEAKLFGVEIRSRLLGADPR